ncbi:MAG TPA: FHA domain-containing protein [Kiritimatiellia bacterium]|nr:FHA domain-containing protein [Kiritimatiellia bacterium]
MKLMYNKQDGATKEFELGERSITIGRSPDADIILLDEKVSRVHCGIRLWDGEFYIKDLKSKNGTYVNGRRVEVSKLKTSDVIKIGTYTFTFEQPGGTGTETALREMSDEMDLGKGYSTLLKEIVNNSDDSSTGTAKPASEAPAAPKPAAPSAPKPGLRKLPTRPPIRLNIKRPGA